MKYKELIKAIEQEDDIAIFRHQHPDCDAMGSQCALVTWIKECFPNKNVYLMGTESCDQFDFLPLDTVSDSRLSKCMAIILDTANSDRIDDQRYQKCRYSIKIDHHPDTEQFGRISYVQTSAAATCEIIAEFFQEQEHRKVSLQTAIYLYAGLLTDTLCFRTSNTTAHTLAMASYLAAFGVDIPVINRRLFDQTMQDFRFANELRSRIIIDKGLAYAVYEISDLKKWNIAASRARNFIDEMGHVKEFQVWALFTARICDNQIVYDGSLRSKKVPVNSLAGHYNGGGHANAAGVKGLSAEKLKTLISELKNLLD